jgi:hypothetical protein
MLVLANAGILMNSKYKKAIQKKGQLLMVGDYKFF